MKIINHLRKIVGNIQTISVDSMVIKWHISDKEGTYPGLLNSLDELGYKPYMFNSFIQGYWKEGIFNVTTGKHRAAALKLVGIQHADCIVLSEKEGKRREKPLLPENPIKHFAARIMEEMKYKEILLADKDKEVMEILKRNIQEIIDYGNVQG